VRHDYRTKRICPKSLGFDIEDGRLRNVSFEGGCPGNLLGIGRLTEGRDALEVARALSGVTCGKKPTSCPNELSKAIFKALGKRRPAKAAPCAPPSGAPPVAAEPGKARAAGGPPPGKKGRAGAKAAAGPKADDGQSAEGPATKA
jgi:uncharacterized protein (TIGR03905 family)